MGRGWEWGVAPNTDLPATHNTRYTTTSRACLAQNGGGSGTEWWLTCEIMWLFKDGCCWGVGGRAGSCCCCWAVQGRRPRTDWDEVTWLHTSGAPIAIPKAKRRPTKSCRCKPQTYHLWRAQCRALHFPHCVSSPAFCTFPYCHGKIHDCAQMHFCFPGDRRPHLSRFLLPRDGNHLGFQSLVWEMNKLWACWGASSELPKISPPWLNSWNMNVCFLERYRFLVP